MMVPHKNPDRLAAFGITRLKTVTVRPSAGRVPLTRRASQAMKQTTLRGKRG